MMQRVLNRAFGDFAIARRLGAMELTRASRLAPIMLEL